MEENRTVITSTTTITTTTTMYQLEAPIETTIVKRPSATCKTPYVADITIDTMDTLAHTPALGCCGLSDKGSIVIVTKLEAGKTKCSHRVELAKLETRGHTIYVGINPKLAETLIHRSLQANVLSFVKGHTETKREVKHLNSRFDFAGKDASGRPFVLEVKNVPLADYVDVPKKERKQYAYVDDTKEWNEKIAYFPDGYRKNSTEVVSPRALKHIEELATMVEKGYRAILCFVVQRTDVAHFQPSNIDLTYKRAVQEAYQKGVEIRAVQFAWDATGKCEFVRDNLPVVLYEGHGPHRRPN